MYTQETVKQHYVSWFYLKRWISVSPTRQLGIWTKPGSQPPFLAQGRNRLARMDYFYRVNVDQVVLEMMQYKYGLELSDVPVKHILQELPVLAGVTEYMSVKLPSDGRLGVINANYLENKYGRIESPISRDLAKLASDRWENLASTPSTVSSLYDSLLGLYATQLFRTPNVRARLSEEMTTIVLEKQSGSTVLSEDQKDTFLKLIIYVESIKLFDQLRRARPAIDIQLSQGEAKFLTSDAPAQHEVVKVDDRRQFTAYRGKMPLSPRHFMTIRKDGQTPARITLHAAGDAEVNQVNQTFVRDNQGNELYAATRDSLIHA